MDRPITLADVFAVDRKDLLKQKAQEMECLAGVAALKERIAKEAKEIRWPVALEEMIAGIDGLLNVPFGDVLASAWNKYHVLAKYLDREKYAAADTFLVPLAEHTVRSRHKPHLDLYLDDRKIGRIDFDVDLSLAIKGFIAKVRDGRIHEITAGTCKVKGTIRCENMLLVEKESESAALPGKIAFADGVPIA